MNYLSIFGPVPSRRLGLSLGIDLTIAKTCSLDCVYCECGKTTKLSMTRELMVQSETVIAELKHFFLNNPEKHPQFLTLSGTGEPTLALNIGEIINYLKDNFSIPVCVLTNSSLLWRDDVQKDLLAADIVIPSLDAVSKNIFEKINRPHPEITVEKIIQGLINFRNIFHNKIFLEILLIKNFNDQPEELIKINAAAKKICPDKIQLNTCSRPGTVDKLIPLSNEELKSASLYFKDFNVEIAGAFKSIATIEPETSAIIELLKRRFCSINDLSLSLNYSFDNMEIFFDKIKKAGYSLISEVRDNEKYYKINVTI